MDDPELAALALLHRAVPLPRKQNPTLQKQSPNIQNDGMLFYAYAVIGLGTFKILLGIAHFALPCLRKLP